MEIRNFTQFVGLINSKGLVNLHPSFSRVVTCLTVYNSLCNCGGNSNQEKSNKLTECNRYYREAVSSIDGFKAHLFQGINDNSISFYVDSSLLKTICR